MKFVVTGAAGNVSKALTKILLSRGHEVTVIGRKAANLASLVKLGARAAVGELQDVALLTDSFQGADGVYLMLPPFWQASDIKKISTTLAEGYSKAIRASGARNVVFLSSYGAHRLDDAGAISGMGRAEVVLNKLESVNVLHLRAGYFYTNLFLSIDQIRNTGIMGNMFAIPAGHFPVVDPQDIAIAAADALTKQDFHGHSIRYVVSDESGTDEIASLIGKEIGKPNLTWVKLTAAEIKEGLVSIGFVEGAANEYVEMFTALDKGLLFEDYVKVKPKLYNTSIEKFAKQFAARYRTSSSSVNEQKGQHSSNRRIQMSDFLDSGEVTGGAAGQRIFFRSARPTETPRALIVIVPGFNAHSGYYAWAAAQLAATGFAVYAVDLRGRGNSDGERFYVENFEDYVSDVDAVVKVARSRESGLPLFLLGHSAGGVVSCLYTLDHQAELAGLICESFAHELPAPEFVLASFKGLGHVAPHAHILHLPNDRFSRDPKVVVAMNEDPLIANETQPAQTMAALVRADERLKKDSSQITLPVLILHGTHDKNTKPAGSQHFYDRVGSVDKTLRFYEGSLHDLLNDTDKDAVMQDIQGWILGRLPAATLRTSAQAGAQL